MDLILVIEFISCFIKSLMTLNIQKLNDLYQVIIIPWILRAHANVLMAVLSSSLKYDCEVWNNDKLQMN